MKKEGRRSILLIVFLVVFISFISSFASASLLSTSVTPSTGEVGQYQIYNFTITNTNNPPNVNFTQIVLVAPMNMSISGHGTSSTGTYSYSSSTDYQSLSWNNSAGIVKNGATQYFWVNASLNEYAYFHITVAALDTNGNTNQTIVNITANDTVKPNINFISPTPANNSVLKQSYIPVKVSASDFGSGVKNITIYLYNFSSSLIGKETNTTSPFFYNFTNLSYGSYTIAASAVDVAGNLNQTFPLGITLSNSVACTISNWSCSWGSCINGTKTQRCIDLNGCNSTILVNGTASCTSSEGCSPLLNCTLWLPANCTSGQQTKTCVDLNNCTAPTVSTRNCTSSGTSSTTSSSKFSFPKFNLGLGKIPPSTMIFAGVIAFIVIVMIVLFVIIRKLRRS